MELPDNSIGVTDILGWRDCGRRMHFGMRRHTPAGEHPEAQSPSTAYGSAFHDAVAYQAENDTTMDEAAQYAFDTYGQWLDPSDLLRLNTDLVVYMDREPLGVRVIGVEVEVKIPLFTHNGEQIFFRGKIDRLYQSLEHPGTFIHKDYKTSKHPKSEEEVHNDVQMWAYNWAIHEFYPECENLQQEYDQLGFGILKTSKGPQHREQIREWLVRQATAILRDENYGEDGLLAPKRNRWCSWCVLAESCSVVHDATDWARTEIAGLAPERKEGRKTVVDIDELRVEEYTEQLEEVNEAIKILTRFQDSVKALLRDMPEARRISLGYGMRKRDIDVMPPEGMRTAREVLGDDLFDQVASISKTAIEKRITDEEVRTRILSLMEKRAGSRYVQKAAVKK